MALKIPADVFPCRPLGSATPPNGSLVQHDHLTDALPAAIAPSGRRALGASIGVAIAAVATRLPGVFTNPVEVFDEGNRLASAGFAGDGLLLFRDYYEPYGPGRGYLGALLRWVGLDSVLASRILFFAAGVLLATLVTYAIARRRGIVAGLFVGFLAIAFQPTNGGYGETFTLAYVVVVAAVVLLEETRLRAGVRPFVDEGLLSDRSALLAGILISVAAWFRFEFSLLLIPWLALIWTRPSSGRSRRNRAWLAIPFAVAAFPYALIVAMGGLGHMTSVVEYAVTGYSEYRGRPPDYGRLQAVRELATMWRVDLGAWTVAMSLTTATLGVPLLVIGKLADRFQPLARLRLFGADPSRVAVLTTSFAILALWVTRVRADTFHLTLMVVPLWLALAWSPSLARWVVAVVSGVVVVMTLWATGMLGVGGWTNVGAILDHQSDLAGFDDIAIDPVLEEALGGVVEAWEADGSPSEVFVANRTNDFTELNAPLVYYVLDVRPASWLTNFDPGLTDQSEQHLTISEALCESRAPVILMETPKPETLPLRLQGLSFSPDLDRFLALNYNLAAGDQLFEYRTMTDSGCVRLSAIDAPSDLDLRLDEVRERGDERLVLVLTGWRLELEG